MNSALSVPRRAPVSLGIMAVLCMMGMQAHAQQGLNADEFYRTGDRLSDRFANFMRGIFGSGAPNPVASMNPPPSQMQSSGYNQSPVASPNYSPRGATSTKSKRSYQPSAQAAVVPKKSTKSSTRTTTPRSTPPDTRYAPAEEPGVYTSTKSPKKTSDTVPASTGSGSASGSVVRAPTSDASSSPRSGSGLTAGVKTTPPASSSMPPAAGTGTISAPPSTVPAPPSTVSAPPSSPSGPSTTPSSTPKATSSTPSTTPAPSSPPASQNFPVGTVGKKPGRVVSPYPPHNELDVRELPSGSLALDPTTQKIFRVP